MSMWCFLALGIDAGAFVLDEGCGFSEGAIGFDGKRGDASAAVIGHEDEFARAIHRNVAGTRSARRLVIEKGEFSRLQVNREGAYGAAAPSTQGIDFIGRVEEFSIWMDGKEAGAGGFGC